MNKLFNNPKDQILSTEMIEPQHNDYILPALRQEFKSIIDGIRDHTLINSDAIFKNKTTYANITNIDTIITERFGISFKHVANTNNNYGIWTTPPSNYNILYKNIEDDYNNSKDYIKTLNKQDSGYKTVEQIKYAKYDTNDMLFNWIKSVKALDKTLNTSNVTIDYKQARIIGLPTDYKVFILGDIYSLIVNMKLDENELTAILLHEIGHAFNTIEYAYRSVNNTSVLLDSLQTNISKKNKSFKDSLVLAYEHTYNEKLSKDTIDSKLALIHILGKHIDKNTAMNNVPHGNTDNEQLADQFTARFGEYNSLSTALEKVYLEFDNNPFEYKYSNVLILFILPMLYFSIIVILLTGLLSAGLLFIGGYTLTVSITYLLQSILTSGNMSTGDTYDDTIRRIIRIKNDMVRQLRIYGKSMDKNDIDNILANITRVDKVIETIPKMDNTTFIDRFIRNYTSSGKQAVRLKLTEQLIEDLTENDLHIATYKLKDIK